MPEYGVECTKYRGDKIVADKKGNKSDKGNKGGGRKTAYKEGFSQIAFQLCLLGATDEEMSIAFGVSEVTINNWKKKHKEFSLALHEAKNLADSRVVERLYQRAMGYEHEEEKIFCHEGEIIRADTIKHYPPEFRSMSFWLRNRQPDKFREKVDVEHAGEVEIVRIIDDIPKDA